MQCAKVAVVHCFDMVGSSFPSPGIPQLPTCPFCKQDVREYFHTHIGSLHSHKWSALSKALDHQTQAPYEEEGQCRVAYAAEDCKASAQQGICMMTSKVPCLQAICKGVEVEMLTEFSVLAWTSH